MPSWGVLQPEESLTRPASLEEADPDLYQSLARLEDRLASSLEETRISSTAGWRCDCKVKNLIPTNQNTHSLLHRLPVLDA